LEPHVVAIPSASCCAKVALYIRQSLNAEDRCPDRLAGGLGAWPIRKGKLGKAIVSKRQDQSFAKPSCGRSPATLYSCL
jgi:hypothetical protein